MQEGGIYLNLGYNRKTLIYVLLRHDVENGLPSSPLLSHKRLPSFRHWAVIIFLSRISPTGSSSQQPTGHRATREVLSSFLNSSRMRIK